MTLKFVEKTHRYFLDSNPVPGVTTLLDKGIPKPALTYWAARTVAEFVADHPDIVEAVKAAGGRAPAVAMLKEVPFQKRDDAAIRGTDVHALAEKLVHGEEVQVPEHLTGYVTGYVEWLDAFGFRPLVTERPVANRKWAYAGKPDAIGTFEHGPLAGKTVLLDWKTSRGVYGETALQTAAYARAEFYVDDNGDEIPMPHIDATGVVHIQDGLSELYVLADDPEQIDEAFKVFSHIAYVARKTDWIKAQIKSPIEVEVTADA